MAEFRYDKYTSPYVGSISQMIGGQNDARARALEIGGNAQAAAAQQSGAAWAGAAQNIGQSIAAIPQQMQQAKLNDTHQRQMAAAAAENEAQAAQRMQGIADLKAFDKALETPGGRDAVINSMPGHLRPQLLKQYQEADTLAANAKKAAQQAKKDQQEYVGYLGAQVHLNDYDPKAALSTLHHAREAYADDPDMLKQIDGMRQQFIENPESIKQTADAAILGSSYKDLLKPKEAKTREVTTVGPDGKPQIQIVEDKAGQSFAVPPKDQGVGTVHDTANGLVRISPDNTITPLGVKGYHPPPSSLAEGATKLSDDAVADLATRFRILGSPGIPTRIGEDDKKRIFNEAAQQAKSLGQTPVAAVQKQAAFKSDATSLTLMRKLSSSAEAFESKAIAQSDIVKDLSQKVDRSQMPLLNRAILTGNKELLGDADTQLLYNAITTFTSEYAKIMEGSTGSVAASSDSARKAAGELIKASLNKDTLAKTVDLMKREMRLSIQGYGATIDHITERMGGNKLPSETPTQAPSIEQWERGPDGKLRKKAGG